MTGFDQLPYLLTLLGTGLLLGMRHSLDADHIAAMSTLVSRAGGIGRSLRWGALWGTGHTATLFTTGFVVLVFKLSIPDGVATLLEVLVGFMLIWLGVLLYSEIMPKEDRGAAAAEPEHRQSSDRVGARPFFVGAVHGLAGSAALLLLVLSTVDSLVVGTLYILFFGVGSIGGMLAFSGVIAIPMAWSTGHDRLHRGFRSAAAMASILVGVFVVVENLFG